jgi:hypothetical protein
MSKCSGKCEVCADCSHHWLDNATGNPVDPLYICKHCDALGDDCMPCQNDDCDDKICEQCGGEGIYEVT